MAAGGLYYMKNVNNTTEKKEEEESNNFPYIIAIIILFSLKKEIEETISKERIYTLLAISAASYLHTIDAELVKIISSTIATLIVLPAIQEYEKK
jgi:hypothetical protein